MGDRQAIEFYVNPAIVARDILLLTLASRTPQPDKDNFQQFVDSFVNIYADLSLDEDARQ